MMCARGWKRQGEGRRGWDVVLIVWIFVGVCEV